MSGQRRLAEAADALRAALAAETAALEGGDFAGAARAGPEKARAIEVFLGARAEAVKLPKPPAEAEAALRALGAAASANRAALERALAVQGRVVDVVARAAQGSAGAVYSPRRPEGVAPVAISVEL